MKAENRRREAWEREKEGERKSKQLSHNKEQRRLSEIG